MKILPLIIIAATMLLLDSCNSSKKTVKNTDNTEDFCESMTYNSQPIDNISSDYYSTDTLFVENNCLNIWVSYTGGCGDADFILYYSNNVKESSPPETTLRLQLIKNDPCKATVQQKLFYNLSFFDEYAEKDGILLELTDTDKSVMYIK